MGVNTNRSGTKGFIVSGHCTEENQYTGGVQGTNFYQPSSNPPSNSNLIGTEVTDPPFTSSPSPLAWACAEGQLCRLSDSAFVAKPAGVKRNLGKIAKPTAPGGTLKVDHQNKFRIVNDSTVTAVGDIVWKVGAATGYSDGKVTHTCEKVAHPDDPIQDPDDARRILLCQHIVENLAGGIAAEGDSGAPVFKVTNSPNAGDVALLGILYGGNLTGTAFGFSPIGNVYTELSLIEAEVWKSCDPAIGC